MSRSYVKECYPRSSGTVSYTHLTITELEPAAGYSIKDPTSQQVYVEAGRGKVVTFENTPLSAIIVKKVDSSTGDPLQGAWFRVRFLGGTSGRCV